MRREIIRKTRTSCTRQIFAPLVKFNSTWIRCRLFRAAFWFPKEQEAMIVVKISAFTLKVTNMARSVHFYNEILHLEVIYGGPDSSFTSLRTAGAQDAILNLEQGACSSRWGRLIFHVSDVD